MKTNTDLERLEILRGEMWNVIEGWRKNYTDSRAVQEIEKAIDKYLTAAFDLGQMLEADKCKNHG